MFKIMFKKTILKLQTLFIPCQENNHQPRFLQSNFLPYLLIFLFILKFIFVPFLIYFPETNLFADISKTVLIELTNNERKKLGLNQLKENSQLNQAALLKAQDILANGYFSHWSPQGKSPWYWFKKANYKYQTAGENLGIGFLDSEEVYQAWENSPSHKANLLGPNYQEIGIAVLSGNFKGNEATIVVQLFGAPAQKSGITNQELRIISQESKTTNQEKVKEEIISQTTTTTSTPIPTEVLSQTLTTSTQTTTASEIVSQITTTSEIVSSTVPIEIKKEIVEEKVAGIEEQKPVSAKAMAGKKEKTGLFFGLLKFLSTDYFKIIQKIVFYSLFFVLLALLINILIHIKIQYPRLIVKTIFCIFLLILLVLADKNFIIQMIPHTFGIL